MIEAVFVAALANFVIGFVFGYVFRYNKETEQVNHNEKETYLHGYEDGFYLGCGDYEPEVFRIEIAEGAYQEYKGLKHGPVKH